MLNKKVYLFDLDGVITSTDSYHFEAWCKMAEKVGIELDPEFENKLKGVARTESLKLILEENNVNVDEDKFNELLEFKNNYYINLLTNLNEENRFDNILELLQTIQEKGYKSILVSASKNAPAILEKVKLLEYFNGIVDAGLITKSKPDPEVLIRGVEISGMTKNDCVVIEDSQSGIDAANNAGIDVIAYEPNGTVLNNYTHKVTNHMEIINKIKGG